jgi:hypothetical protein
MKKNKAQFYKLQIGLLCMFLIGTTFISCEAEKDIIVSDGKMIVKQCSMKDANLQSNSKLKQAVNKLKSIQSSNNFHVKADVNSKLVYDEKLGLFYDDEKGIYVKKDGKESYNFPIIQTDDTEKIKNITFNKNAFNEYDIYLVKYDYTKEDTRNYSKEALAQREVKYQAILKNGVEYPIESQWYICVITTTTETWSEEHEGFTYICVTVIVSTECESGGGGSGPSIGVPSPGGVTPPTAGGEPIGGDGGVTNPVPVPVNTNNPLNNNETPSIIAVAVIDDAIPEPDIDDITVIQSLNQLTNRQEVKERIVEVQGQISTVQMEQGSEFFTDLDNPTNPLEREDLTPRFSGINFNPVSYESIIRLHSHHNPLLEPTFSAEDIAGMGRFYKSKRDFGAGDALNATSILVSNLGLHSLRVSNPEKAYLFSQRLVSSTYRDLFLKNYRIKVQKPAKDDCNCSENNEEYQQLLLQYLIQFLADQDIGLSLFSGVINADGNVTWSR